LARAGRAALALELESSTGEVPAIVTGTVSEKDGKKWLAATKIEKR
jgi:hypothetical protein